MLKSRRTKLQSLDEDAWRLNDSEGSDEGWSNVTPLSTRAANVDKYFVAPLAEDGLTNTLACQT
jgi:hypothetical protein